MFHPKLKIEMFHPKLKIEIINLSNIKYNKSKLFPN